MRAIIVLTALMVSAPAGAQTLMYVRPPLAVVCERLDYAKAAAAMAYEASITRKPVSRFPDGCRIVKPPTAVAVLDQFDDYVYVEIERWRAFVHVGALSPTPEAPPQRRRR